MLDLDELEREVRAWRDPTPALVVALIERLREAESDREALMEGLGLDPSPEALAEQRAQFGTEGLVWRWRDEIATSDRARLEAENARLREALEQYADRTNWVSERTVYRDCWVYYEHGYDRAWKALGEARAALGEASHE